MTGLPAWRVVWRGRGRCGVQARRRRRLAPAPGGAGRSPRRRRPGPQARDLGRPAGADRPVCTPAKHAFFTRSRVSDSAGWAVANWVSLAGTRAATPGPTARPAWSTTSSWTPRQPRPALWQRAPSAGWSAAGCARRLCHGDSCRLCHRVRGGTPCCFYAELSTRRPGPCPSGLLRQDSAARNECQVPCVLSTTSRPSSVSRTGGQ